MSRTLNTFSGRLSRVRSLSPKLRIAALGESLAACSPTEAEALALELLELAVLPAFDPSGPPVRPHGLLSLIRRISRASRARLADRALAQISRFWAFIPAPVVPAALAAGENRWQDVIRQVATDPSRLPRLSVAKLAGDTGDSRLGFAAASMLFDQDEQVAHAAERALVTLCLSLLRQDIACSSACRYLALDPDVSLLGRGLVLGLSGEPDELCAQVSQAAMNYGEHRRRAPILGAIILAERARLRGTRPGAVALRTWLANESHPSQAPLRTVLRWSRMPVARLRALEWLGQEHLAGAAGERLLKAHSLIEHELVLAQAHLLTRPARAVRAGKIKLQAKGEAPVQVGAKAPARRPVRRTSAVEGPIPGSSALRHLSPAARMGLRTFLGSFSAGAPLRRAAFEPFLADSIPAIRHSAARAMPTSGLADFCFDGNVQVARTAFLSWSAAGAGLAQATTSHSTEDRRLLSLLSRSQHKSIAGWAKQDLEWVPKAGQPAVGAAMAGSLAGRLAARRLLAADRPKYISLLRGGLSRGKDVLGTLLLVRALELTAELEPEVVALTEAGMEPRLLATAIAALGDVGNTVAIAAATRLLGHSDDRVRANAVESLGHRKGRPAVIAELKSDAHHRVRANAIRAEILAEPEGALRTPGFSRELTQILSDTRPMHRLAGLWLAGRTLTGAGRARAGDRWPELVARISEVARFDDEPRVRARAASCAQRLAAELRLSWRTTYPMATHAS
jgi:hypothetical protein